MRHVTTGTTSTGTFDLTGANNFDANLDQFYVGVKGDNNDGYAVGVATLATNNDITANEIKVGRTGNNGGSGNELHFGSGTNDVITPVFTVGEWKSQGSLVDVAAGGTVNLGDSGNRVALTIGLKNTSTGVNTTGAVDFSAGTANIFATNINIAQESNTGGSGSPVGTLTLGDGMLDVTGNVSEVNNDQGASRVVVVGDQTFTVGGVFDIDNLTLGENDTNGTADLTADLELTTGGTYTVGALDVVSDSAVANILTIPTGQTLTVNGNMSVGVSDTNQETNLTAGGGGTLTVNAPSGNVDIGLETDPRNGTPDNDATVDLSGLGAFNADVKNFNVGLGGRLNSSLVLSDTSNEITATTLRVGDAANDNSGSSSMTLGAGTNLLNATNINIGLSKGRSPFTGSVAFASQVDGSPGTVTIRGKTGGTSAANITIGSNPSTGTSSTAIGILDLRGHSADVNADTLTIGRLGQSTTGGATGRMYIDDGDLVVDTLLMASRTGTGTGDVTGELYVDGADVSINTVTIADRNAGDDDTGNATGTYTQTGGTLTVGTGTEDLIIGRNGGDTASSSTPSIGTMNASGASSVTINVDDLRIGLGGNRNNNNGYGDLILSASGTNTITATTVTVGASAGTGNTGATSTLQLGSTTNTINTNTLTVGGAKSKGELKFDSGGTLTLNGKGGAGTDADVFVGRNNAGTGVNNDGVFDMSGGTINAEIDQFVIGLHNSGSGSGNGVFTMEDGFVQVNDITLADTDVSGTSTNDANTDGIFNLKGGTLVARGGTIDDGGGTAAFNWTGGTLRDVGTFGIDLTQDDTDNPSVLDIGEDDTAGNMVVNGNYVLEGGVDNVFRVDIDGNSAGVSGGYDQLDANGTVTLNGGSLSLEIGSAGATTIGDTFVIINNDGIDPVSGIFAGIADGTFYTATGVGVDDQLFFVDYDGGTGNDVVLTRTLDPTTSIELDGSGNLIIEDDTGDDTVDNLTLDVVNIGGTDYLRVHDPDNVVGSTVPGGTQISLHTVLIPLDGSTAFNGDIVVNTLGSGDTVTVGDLGDKLLPGGIQVNGGDGFDNILYNGSGSVLDDTGGTILDGIQFTAEEIDFRVHSDITTTNGDIIATATGGSGKQFQGVHLYGADLEVVGTGNVTLTGQGGDDGNSNHGVHITNESHHHHDRR